ncbi:MAG: outer membrane protein transport protein [Kiritimatiellales bacterium]|nr:outer membrane protein transport protein [Kiritimatiellota bacterium]MBL7012123.1 outer membrane protein transport protein [Kiritimatiellales bacterium]
MKNKLIIALTLAWIASISAHATEGINLIGIGPIQQGTAGAGVASAKNSTWLILNPAGLTDLERGADASIQYFAPNRTINSGMSGGAGKQTDDSAFFIPSISTSFGCCRGTNGYLGIGIYGTSGMGVDYNQGRVGDLSSMGPYGPTAPQNQVDQMTELSVAKMTLTYAEKLDNGWSVGGGPVFVLSRLRTDMLNSSYAAQSGDWDTAVGLGFIIGVNKQINDKLKIGGSYMTEQFMTEFDEYSDLLDGSLNLPQQLTVGLAYNVLTNVEVALDYRWVGWGELDTLGDQFGWENQNIVKAGISWDVNERLTLRSGISHGNSPIGNGDAAFANALFPAIMETHLAGGLSYQFDSFRLDIAAVHALEASRYDSATATDISMSQNSLTIGAGWEF